MNNNEAAALRAAMPIGTDRFLNTRTLQTDHRHLASRLKPGMAVLDVGCGTGAITRGIAEAVGPLGSVTGLDASQHLLDQAREANRDLMNMRLEEGDVFALPWTDTFDIVTSARMLQWLDRPLHAIESMVRALKPGGLLVCLDYNHVKANWSPALPESMQALYEAFLRWRADAGMDNELGDHQEQMFREAGLVEIRNSNQDEISRWTDPNFEARASLWSGLAATRGRQMVSDGYLDEVTRAGAEKEMIEWARNKDAVQHMYLVATEGRRE